MSRFQLRKRPSFPARSLLFIPALLLLAFLTVAAQAANLEVWAPTGTATISQGGVYNQLEISGSQNPVLEVTRRLNLVGAGNTSSLITNAVSARLHVLSSTLNLGTATNVLGGILPGDISLEDSTLQVYGSPFSADATYTIAPAGSAAGLITGDGTVSLRPRARLLARCAGSATSPLAAIRLEAGSTMQLWGPLHARDLGISSASVSLLAGDAHVADLYLDGKEASLQASTGNLFLNNVSSSSPDRDATGSPVIAAAKGDVTIAGSLRLSGGLTSIQAGGDINLLAGGASAGDGVLYLRATGNLNAGNAGTMDARLEALRMDVGGTVSANNVLAAQVKAGNLAVSQNLEIRGNAIMEDQVRYGSLAVSAKGNSVGGDLSIHDALLDIPELKVGGDVVLSGVDGNLGDLNVRGSLDAAAGNLSGSALKSANILIGESEYPTSLNVDSVEFGSLRIGRLGSLDTRTLAAPNGSIRLENGGKLEVAEGDIGSPTSPLTAISLGTGSNMTAPASVYARALTGAPTANAFTARGNIQIFGPISGHMDISTPGTVTATNVTANSLHAGNAVITAGTLHLAEAGTLTGDLLIHGSQAPGAVNYGAFSSLQVGGSLVLSGAQLAGNQLEAGKIYAGGSAVPTILYASRLSTGFGLAVGSNAWVTLGGYDTSWAGGATAGSIGRQRQVQGGVLGLVSPIVVGNAGLEIDPASVPILHPGHINFASGSTLAINAARAKENVNPAGMISASVPMAATVHTGARLVLDGVAANQNYAVLGSNITTTYASAAAWDERDIESGAHLVQVRKIPGKNGWFTTNALAAGDVYPGLDPGLRPPLDEGNSTPSPDAPARPEQPDMSPVLPDTPEPPALPGIAPGIPEVPGQPAPPGELPIQPDLPGTIPGTSSVPGLPASPNPNLPEQSGPAAPSGPAIGTEIGHFNSRYAGVRFLSRVTSVKYMDHNYRLAWSTMEGAARVAILGGAPQLTHAANMGAYDASQSRATCSSDAQAIDSDHADHVFSLWITPSYRNLQRFSLQAYNLDYDLSGNIGGIVLGADSTFSGGMRLGIDASIGGGYSRSGGNLARTTNRMGYAGLGAYAGWQNHNLGLSTGIQYTRAWHSLKQEFPACLDMRDPTAELTSGAISAGAEAKHALSWDRWQLVPYAGVRYSHIQTDNYSVYSGGAMLDGQTIRQNIWTFPFGLKLAASLDTGGDWQIRPALDFRVTPAAGDVYATTDLHFTGVPGEGSIKTQTMDYWQFGGGASLKAETRTFSLGLDYQVSAGRHSADQSLLATIVYKF